MLWLLNNYKNPFALIINIIALFLLIKIRYAGIIYPIITLIVFVWHHRLRGWYVSLLSVVVLVIVYQQGVSDNKRLFNVNTFSGFGGWAKATSAVSILPYVTIDTLSIKDKEMRRISNILTQFPDSTYSNENIFKYNFMWAKDFPGKVYMRDLNTRNPQWNYVKNWVHAGDNLEKYASFLTFNYPLEYCKRFVAPNIYQFIFSPDDLTDYSQSKELISYLKTIDPDFHQAKVKYDLYRYIGTYPSQKNIFLIIVCVILSVIAFINRNKFELSSSQKMLLKLILVFVLFNVAYLILLYPITFRFVAFLNIFLCLYFVILSHALLKGSYTSALYQLLKWKRMPRLRSTANTFSEKSS